MFYTNFDTTGQAFAMGDAPFGLFVNGASHPYLEQPYTNYGTGANNLQPFPWVPPTGADTNFAPFQPIAFSPAFNTHNKLPYSINYHLTWQRELWRSTIFSAGYVGSMGRHLYQQIANNLGNPQLCLQIAAAGGGCGPGGEDSIYTVGAQTYYGTRQYSVTSGKYLSLIHIYRMSVTKDHDEHNVLVSMNIMICQALICPQKIDNCTIFCVSFEQWKTV